MSLLSTSCIFMLSGWVRVGGGGDEGRRWMGGGMQVLNKTMMYNYSINLSCTYCMTHAGRLQSYHVGPFQPSSPPQTNANENIWKYKKMGKFPSAGC